MQELKTFENPDFGQVRTMERNGEPWFVGKDVAAALGYSDTKSAIVDHVDTEDKTLVQRGQIATLEIPNRGLTIINESGLYSLILSSKLPTAKKFKHWVTSEVIPSIRKNGAYMTEKTLEAALLDPHYLVKLAQQLADEHDQRLKLETQVEEQKPKVLFAECVESAKTDILVGELAKLLKQNGYPTGQNRLFETLRKDGFLICRTGVDRNMPTQKAMEMGLFRIKETTITHADGHISISKTVKVTGKGQVYFVNRYCGTTRR